MEPSNVLFTWIFITILGNYTGGVFSTQCVTGTDGGSVNITVTVNGTLPPADNRQITWRFNTIQIVTVYMNYPPRYTANYTGRCSVVGDTTLRLDKLTPSDQGDYTLTVQNLNSGITVTGSTCLTVYSNLTSPVLNTTSGNLIYGTNVTLQCDAGTQSVVNYNFYRDGKDVCSQPHVTCNKDLLYFRPITLSDSGTYNCTIENPISKNSSAPLSLKVKERVSNVTIRSNVSSGPLWVGQDSVSLTCSALGTDVTYSWNLNGSSLPNGQRYKLTNNNSTLTISPVQKVDDGSFTCIASNDLNKNSSTLNLNLNWSPDGNIECRASSSNQTVMLLCSWPGGRPAANVTLGFQNISGTEQNIVTRNVTRDQVQPGAELSCNGEQQGQGKTSCIQILNVPVGSPSNPAPTAVLGGTATMTVSLTRSRAAIPINQPLPAMFSWFHINSNPDKPINNGGKFSIISSDYQSELVISTVTESDNGTYQCKAENFMGISTYRFELSVKLEPVTPESPANKPGLSGGEIAGIVIGVLAGLVLIGVAVFFIVKANKKKSKDKNKTINLRNPAEKTQDDKADELKYAELNFQGKNSPVASTQHIPETEYSTVKTAKHR